MLSALIPSRLSYSAVLLAEQPMHQGSVQHGPLVLVSDLRKFPAPTTDRDRTVSRRSEPSSRATLMGEQPNPWDLLQPQDVTSRHRGAKPLRRYELLGGISLLSPEYLLSFERWPFHTEPPDHYALVLLPDRRVGLSVKHPCAITLSDRLPIGLRVRFRSLRYAFGGDHPSQTTHQTVSSLLRVSAQTFEGPYFNSGSPTTGVAGSLASGLSYTSNAQTQC